MSLNGDFEAKGSGLSSLINFLIIDDFLEPEVCSLLHDELLENQMWRFKNPNSKHLYNSAPKTRSMNLFIIKAGEKLKACFSESLNIIDYWCLLYSKNTDGNMHADFGQWTLTYWLTPTYYNLNSKTGGLVIYDVRREPTAGAQDYLVAGEGSERYVSARTKGRVIIPYRCNRAVIFDASHYHKSHNPSFDISTPQGMRMNLTIAYATSIHIEQQISLIKG